MSMLVNPYRFGSPAGTSAHRYWDFYITANDGSALYMGLTELLLLDVVDGTQLVVPASTGSSQINTDNAIAKAFDGNRINSGWLSATAGSPQRIRADFGVGNEKAIVQIFVYGSHNAPDASPKDFHLRWSDDDVTFTPALTVTGQTGWTGSGDFRAFLV